MIYAVYRCLYGEDFIRESSLSIKPYVDKIFLFWDNKVWGDVDHCYYKGKKYIYPKKFDNTVERAKEVGGDKLAVQYDHRYRPQNQYTMLVNEKILPNYPKPKTFLFLDPDYVFRRDQIEEALQEFEDSRLLYASTSQVELWKKWYQVKSTRPRITVMFWDMQNTDELPKTQGNANPVSSFNMMYLKAYVHNLGFCVSNKTMLWKHLTALGFHEKINESSPNEDWYDKMWLGWHPKTNNRNLGISKGHERYLPKAILYDRSELPEGLR